MSHYETYTDHADALDLYHSPEGTYTIFDLPLDAAQAAPSIAEGLQKRGYIFHLLSGEDRPEGMARPFGLWPHPDEETREFLTRETGLLLRTPEQRQALLAQTAIEAA